MSKPTAQSTVQRKRGKQAPHVPDYVRTTFDRAPSQLATSEATRKSHEAKRGVPIIVPDSVKMHGTRLFSVKELMDFRIDTSYQREEVTAEVNNLITIIKRGGMIPDPISLVERRYGDRGKYVVDGQQRWWAHVDCAKPVLATVYLVDSYEDEVKLFHALNTHRRVSAENKIRSLPGPLGDTLRRLNEQPESPLFGVVKSTQGSHRISAIVLGRGITALLSNTVAGGGLERIQPAFDRYYQSAPRKAEEYVDMYANLIARVFRHQRMNPVTAVALGRMCHSAWRANSGVPYLPTESQLRQLEAVKWGDVCPTSAAKWLPMALDRAVRIWPVDMLKEDKLPRQRKQKTTESAAQVLAQAQHLATAATSDSLSGLVAAQLRTSFLSGGLLLMAVGAVVAWARNIPLRVLGWIKHRVTVSLTVDSYDQTFEWVTIWLACQPYAKRARSLVVDHVLHPEVDGARTALFAPGPGAHFFWWQRRPVWLSRTNAQPSKGGGNESHAGPRSSLTLTIVGRSQAPLRAIMAEADVAARDYNRIKPHVFVPDGISWRPAAPAPKRSMESVVLPVGDAESLIDDIRSFQTSRSWYDERCIPYRRAYCLTGLPGTGKTSLVAAVAHALKFSIYSANLSAIAGDNTLGRMISSVTPNSILLLEDIDAAQRSREQPQSRALASKQARTRGDMVVGANSGDSPAPTGYEEMRDGVTLSGLLNALDGVATPPGLIVVYTTNYFERIDPAMRRPGRMDRIINFTYADASQGERMYTRFFGPGEHAQTFGKFVAGRRVTTAEIQEYLMERRDDWFAALYQTKEIAASRVASEPTMEAV